jgi:tetratricopeptide (TPR) repeat protein
MDDLRMSSLWQSLHEYRSRLLEHCLAPVAEGTTLPWGWLENRPPLRLLLEAGLDAEFDAESNHARRWFERLLALDPDDSQGALPLLVNLLLREGRNEGALGWIEQDRARVHPEPAFGAVLALARLGRVRDAEAAFREAHRKLPKVLGHLRQERKPPRDLQPGRVRLGGDDQAWYYGDDMRDQFRAESGLVAFMTDLAKRMGRGL